MVSVHVCACKTESTALVAAAAADVSFLCNASRARSPSSSIRASSASAKLPRAPNEPCDKAAECIAEDRPVVAASIIRRALMVARASASPVSRVPGAPAAARTRSALVALPLLSSDFFTSGFSTKARTAWSCTRGTRTVTTRDRIVGSSAPGSLEVRMIVVSAGGSSRSLRKALAAMSAPSWGTIRSASPMMKTFRRPIAGAIAARWTRERTVAT